MQDIDKKMLKCDLFDPDKIFRKFKVIEFPLTITGLYKTQYLDLGVSLEKSACLMTWYNNTMMRLDEAREISAAHRAFKIKSVNDHTIEIKFHPTMECIGKNKGQGNQFICELRLLKTDHDRCCNRERHAEFGRYYISGLYEYCIISHIPQTLNFENVIIFGKKTQLLRIRNESKVITVQMMYVKSCGLDVVPETFVLRPDSQKSISVTIKPNALRITNNKIIFKIVNTADDETESKTIESDDNYLNYTVNINYIPLYNKKPKEIIVPSLHTLHERSPVYTYMGKEKIEREKKKSIAQKILIDAKAAHVPKAKEKPITGGIQCYNDQGSNIYKIPGKNFCKKAQQNITTFDLLKVFLVPFNLDFGEIVENSYGMFALLIKNNSMYSVNLKFLKDKSIRYTDLKQAEVKINLKPNAQTSIILLCYGHVIGNFEDTFNYSIDNKFHLKHRYKISVNVPKLFVPEQNLKFGMISSDNCIMSVPCKIYNHLNVPINFEWGDIPTDIPFQIIPRNGAVPERGCKICDIMYMPVYNSICSKYKSHDIVLISKESVPAQIPITLNLISRKVTVKFMNDSVLFNSVSLNLKTIQSVKLENSSRESVVFHVVEPILPGVTLEPMIGILRPKSILKLQIAVQISYVLEFCVEICVKINNKENLFLTVNGKVVEPDITIHPKLINMPRIPSNFIAYIPITVQNTSNVKAVIEVADYNNPYYFGIYIADGQDKQRIFEFIVEEFQSKIVYIKVHDEYRREYDMYIPFIVNKLLGPPKLQDSSSLKFNYYVAPFFEKYKGNQKVKNFKTDIHKDICSCRISGVITQTWIEFSQDKFEIDYVPGGNNFICFNIKNVSKYILPINISMDKLMPYFTLSMIDADIKSEDMGVMISDTFIKFSLLTDDSVEFIVKFHPKSHGKYTAVAALYLEKSMTISYSNLTFVGRRLIPVMTSNPELIIFVPCRIGQDLTQKVTLKIAMETELDLFSYSSLSEPNISLKFKECSYVMEDSIVYTIVTVFVSVFCKDPDSKCLMIHFHHVCGSSCDVEVSFCCTDCPLTLHSQNIVNNEQNPYPYYPVEDDSVLYNYLETCSSFLEKWLFQQGFRKELYPCIPDSFHDMSTALSGRPQEKSKKGFSISYLTFLKRIAGPLIKYFKKIPVSDVEEPLKSVKEIHDTYKSIIIVLNKRGVQLWTLRPLFLLSYGQFVLITEDLSRNTNSEIILIKKLLADRSLFHRLNKQCWIDFIIQTYKVFIVDSCFFECTCISGTQRNIVQIIVNWYNENMRYVHSNMRKDNSNKMVKEIENLTTDLTDGIAIISSILRYCSFLKDHFAICLEIDENDKDREGTVIHNACLIVEALNILRISFPLTSQDFMQPNFIQMLFLSIHLYVTLPMMEIKDEIVFNPTLLKTSVRFLSLFPSTREFLQFTYVIINNDNRNNFVIEKNFDKENYKRMCLNIRYTANFIEDSEYTLLIHAFNKTRIFDTYVIFKLITVLNKNLSPFRKCKINGPLYRPIRVDTAVTSPFTSAATFRMFQTDIEPKVPIKIEEDYKRFYVRRLSFIENELMLPARARDSSKTPPTKLHFEIICLSTQVGSTWVWFRSDIGDFFIKIATVPRYDLALDILQLNVNSWPVDPCSCGEECECYRTYSITIPHRNDLMVKALRSALLLNATNLMMNIFDELLNTRTGMKIIGMLLAENGTIMSDVSHILQEQNTYRISSPNLIPQLKDVTFYQYTDAVFTLPITVPSMEKEDRYSIVFTSECGMDTRTYVILFLAEDYNSQ